MQSEDQRGTATARRRRRCSPPFLDCPVGHPRRRTVLTGKCATTNTGLVETKLCNATHIFLRNIYVITARSDPPDRRPWSRYASDCEAEIESVGSFAHVVRPGAGRKVIGRYTSRVHTRNVSLKKSRSKSMVGGHIRKSCNSDQYSLVTPIFHTFLHQ
jgi:hypothetical protein